MLYNNRIILPEFAQSEMEASLCQLLNLKYPEGLGMEKHDPKKQTKSLLHKFQHKEAEFLKQPPSPSEAKIVEFCSQLIECRYNELGRLDLIAEEFERLTGEGISLSTLGRLRLHGFPRMRSPMISILIRYSEAVNNGLPRDIQDCYATYLKEFADD
jgi:hypothetical protein